MFCISSWAFWCIAARVGTTFLIVSSVTFLSTPVAALFATIFPTLFIEVFGVAVFGWHFVAISVNKSKYFWFNGLLANSAKSQNIKMPNLRILLCAIL